MVAAVAGSHEKVDVVQPREDELAGITIERPETGSLVNVDLEAGRFFEFFSDALNQFGEAESVKNQSTHVPRSLRSVCSQMWEQGGRRASARVRRRQNARSYTDLAERFKGISRLQHATSARAGPHSACRRALIRKATMNGIHASETVHRRVDEGSDTAGAPA